VRCTRAAVVVADGTGIEWTEATWNPLVGCTKVSPGCDRCYAETLVNRFAGSNKAFPNRFDVVTMRDERMLTQPLRWTRPRRIFVNSLSDLFHQAVPDEFIAQVFAVMAVAGRHTFQLLTKRHARMRALLGSNRFVELVGQHAEGLALSQRPGSGRCRIPGAGDDWTDGWPLPNVWLGVSVEDQHWADIRIPALLETPAAVRWISAEPLLGPVSLSPWLRPEPCRKCGGSGSIAVPGGGAQCPTCRYDDRLRAGREEALDWVVGGGESGKGARPMHPQWARDLRDQCDAAWVPFLFKQWGHWAPQPAERPTIAQTASFSMGEDGAGVHWRRGTEMWPVGKKAAGRQLDGRTHDGYPEVRRG
jgi:protein gp37